MELVAPVYSLAGVKNADLLTESPFDWRIWERRDVNWWFRVVREWVDADLIRSANWRTTWELDMEGAFFHSKVYHSKLKNGWDRFGDFGTSCLESIEAKPSTQRSVGDHFWRIGAVDSTQNIGEVDRFLMNRRSGSLEFVKSYELWRSFEWFLSCTVPNEWFRWIPLKFCGIEVPFVIWEPARWEDIVGE